MTVPETLRAIGKEFAESAERLDHDEYCPRDITREHKENAAACDAGAAALEIVQRLAEETAIISDDTEPTHYCRFCQCVADEVDDVEHDPACLWDRARSLLRGGGRRREDAPQDETKTQGS